MNARSTKSNAVSNSLTDPSRCQHLYPSGRRCRLPVSDLRSGLCADHSRKLLAREEADLSSTLVGQLQKIETANEVNDVLSRLLILISQDRVAPRRASVIAYICNLLLRTLPAIEYHNEHYVDDEEEDTSAAQPLPPGREPLPATAAEFAEAVLSRRSS